MKEFIDKLIERLEILNQDYDGNPAICEAIEIVNQLAEEHNDGWIACSERLPEEYGTYLCCDKYGEFILGYPIARISSDDYYVETEHEIMNDCIAWQPLPAPYQAKGEYQISD